jgi:uncharacterized membrane protein YGL010W
MQQWFDEYGESHQNSFNKLMHWVCVPIIFFSVIGLFASIPHEFMSQHFSPTIAPFIHFGTVVLILGLVFYASISIPMFLGMLVVALINLWLVYIVELYVGAPLWVVSLTIFVIGWIGQFYGHKVEGKKPSFFKDVQFLMIGPAWLLSFIYDKIGLRY